jgi:hypothetical protein
LTFQPHLVDVSQHYMAFILCLIPMPLIDCYPFCKTCSEAIVVLGWKTRITKLIDIQCNLMQDTQLMMHYDLDMILIVKLRWKFSLTLNVHLCRRNLSTSITTLQPQLFIDNIAKINENLILCASCTCPHNNIVSCKIIYELNN